MFRKERLEHYLLLADKLVGKNARALSVRFHQNDNAVKYVLCIWFKVVELIQPDKRRRGRIASPRRMVYIERKISNGRKYH